MSLSLLSLLSNDKERLFKNKWMYYNITGCTLPKRYELCCGNNNVKDNKVCLEKSSPVQRIFQINLEG